MPKRKVLVFLRDENVKFSLRGLDMLGIPGILLGWISIVSDSDAWLAALLFFSCILICGVILSHKELKGIWLVISCVSVTAVSAGAYDHQHNNNRANELAKNDTNLEPGNLPTPHLPSECVPPKDAFIVILGNNVVIGKVLPRTILRMGQDSMLVIDRGTRPKDIKISLLKIFDDKGDMVVSIRDNVFHAQPQWRRVRTNKSSLVVFDRKDDEVLNAELVNENTLVVSGVFRHEGVKTITADDQGIHVGRSRVSGSCLFEAFMRDADFSIGTGSSSTIGF